MAAVRKAIEFKTPTYYASWLIYMLRRDADKNPSRFFCPSGNYIDEFTQQMRADPKLKPITWERRLVRAQADQGKEAIPEYALQALVACAYAIAAEREEQVPLPNRSWDYAIQAMWWGGLYGGRMDEFDVTHARKKKHQASAAEIRHAETRKMRAEAKQWYEERRKTMSKDAAAEEMSRRIFPVAFRTVRDWLKETAPSSD